jgi:predicted ester cyclase
MTSPTTRAEIEHLFEMRMKAWKSRDPGRLAATHTVDGRVSSPIFGKVDGRPAIEQSYRDLFTQFADWTLEGEPLVIDGQRVAQAFQVHATHTSEFYGLAATGRRFTLQGVVMFEMAAGKIAVEKRIYDFSGFVVQLGLIKARPD